VGSKFSNVRYSGIIPAFDFVPFFFTVFLITKLIENNFKINLKTFSFIVISTCFSLLSGRFAIVYLAYISLIIFVKNFSTKNLLIVISSILLVIIVFEDRINFYLSTLTVAYDYLMFPDTELITENNFSNDYYSLSPLTLIYELSIPFVNIKNYLLPNLNYRFIDPGISYLIINLGFVLTLFIYLFVFKLFKNLNINYSIFLIPLILADFKFQSIFVTMPMFWIFYNIHYLKIKKCI